MILLAALCGMGLAGGVWLVVDGMRPTWNHPHRYVVWQAVHAATDRLDSRRLGFSAALGLLTAVVLRWPVAVLAATALGWFVPFPGQRAARRNQDSRTEAIAQWCEMLRDAAGTARGIEGVLVATASSAPGPIRPEVQRLAYRLESEPLDIALAGLAADLAHPVGDLVVTALGVAATAGSRRVATVMGNLATAAHHETSMRRRVDVARARPRSTLRLVAAIVAVFVAALLVFARDYMAPYGTPVGQFVLVLIGFYWGLGFWWMARLGRVPAQERFLARAGRLDLAGTGAGRGPGVGP